MEQDEVEVTQNTAHGLGHRAEVRAEFGDDAVIGIRHGLLSQAAAGSGGTSALWRRSAYLA
jgi:hypothetical protein